MYILIIVISYVFCVIESQVLWILEGSTVAFLGELVVIECIIVLIWIIVVILNLWCILIVFVTVQQVFVAVHVFIHKLHADLLLLWLLLGKDSLYPGALWYYEYFVVISELLLIETTWFLEAILGRVVVLMSKPLSMISLML